MSTFQLSQILVSTPSVAVFLNAPFPSGELKILIPLRRKTALSIEVTVYGISILAAIQNSRVVSKREADQKR